MLCVSPAQRFITETLQCLGFGSRARQVARGQTKKRRPTSFVPNSISLGLSVLCVWLYYLRSSGPSSFFFGLCFFKQSLFSLSFPLLPPSVTVIYLLSNSFFFFLSDLSQVGQSLRNNGNNLSPRILDLRGGGRRKSNFNFD